MLIRQDETQTVEVLILGFSPVVREGLRAIIGRDETIAVVGIAPDADEALSQIRRASSGGRPVNVVLTETRNHTMDGVEATRRIKDEFPDVAILVLTENIDYANVIDAIHAGAGGYMLLTDMSPQLLLQSIHRVGEGGAQITTALLRTAVKNLLPDGRKTLANRTVEAAQLTEREFDVLRLMGNGDSNKVIAAALSITLDTTNTTTLRRRPTMKRRRRASNASWTN